MNLSLIYKEKQEARKTTIVFKNGSKIEFVSYDDCTIRGNGIIVRDVMIYNRALSEDEIRRLHNHYELNS